jgi:triosephosphate isomerase (TIM)
MRRKLVAGNWKMHGSLAANAKLLGALKQALRREDAVDFAVCAPFPYLSQVSELLAGSAVSWGAQDLSEHASGAFTGEVSASMLLEFGCRYVLVGHSERRTLHGESDAAVSAKFAAAHGAGLVPVLCVGESLAERDGGQMEAILRRQLEAVLKGNGVGKFQSAVVAYEPVWAIGTGRTATPDQAQGAHAFIRGLIAAHDVAIAGNLTIVYGGSVKASNAKELFSMADVDGGLIGGASLVAEDFVAICDAARGK